MEELVEFVGVAFLVSWSFSLPLLLKTKRIVSSTVLPEGLWYFLVGLGPVCAAFFVSKSNSRFQDLVVGPYSQLPAIRSVIEAAVLPAVAIVLGIELYQHIDRTPLVKLIPSNAKALENSSARGSLRNPKLSHYFMFCAICMLILPMEEIGWRGFLLPHVYSLLRSYVDHSISLVLSSIFVGIIWAMWHLPMFFFSPSTLEVEPPFSWRKFVVQFFFYNVALSSVTALQARFMILEAGSLIPATLVHSSFNSIFPTFNIGTVDSPHPRLDFVMLAASVFLVPMAAFGLATS